MAEEIINRVAKSGLVTIDLDDWYPEGERLEIDLASQLWQGLVLKEQDFREWIAAHPWENFTGKHVAVHCSADAIVPHWAFMLVASALSGVAETVVFGDAAYLENHLWNQVVQSMEIDQYTDARLVIKGCSNREVSPAAFMALIHKLQPVAKSIMYGEPCSTVPVWKRPKA